MQCYAGDCGAFKEPNGGTPACRASFSTMKMIQPPAMTGGSPMAGFAPSAFMRSFVTMFTLGFCDGKRTVSEEHTVCVQRILDLNVFQITMHLRKIVGE